jgi:hypothetical protein
MPILDELLIKFAMTRLSDAQKDRMSSLVRQDIDWQRFGRLALNHGIFMVLWQHLKSADPELMTNPFFTGIEYQRAYAVARNLQLANELVSLAAQFEARGIELIPLKGPALAMQAYGDLSARAFLDLDVVVSRSQAHEAVRALNEIGYSVVPHSDGELSTDFMCSTLYRRLTFETTFSRPTGLRNQPEFLVDLHWEVAPPHMLSFEFDYLLENCTSTELCGHQMRCLRPEVLLVVLCAHGTKHRWAEMKWIVDVAELIARTPELDWDLVYQIADRQGISRKIDLALMICEDAFDLDLPTIITNRLRFKNELNALCLRIIRSWTGREVMHDNLRTYWATEMKTTDTFAKRTRFILNELLQPTVPTYFKCPLPEHLFRLYHLIHPSKTALEFVRAQLNQHQPS